MAKFSFLKNIVDLVLFKTNVKNNNNNIILEQYKTAIEMANEITKSRYEFNRFMIMINTALVAAIAALASRNIYYAFPIPFVGIWICCIWEKQINCFKKMIKIKFDSVKKIEDENNFIYNLYNEEDAKREKLKKETDFKSFAEQEKEIAYIFKICFISYLVFVFLDILFKIFMFFVVPKINIYNFFL